MKQESPSFPDLSGAKRGGGGCQDAYYIQQAGLASASRVMSLVNKVIARKA